jgi:hypothetical protein
MGTRTRNFANNILSGGTIDGTDFLSGAVAAPNIANSSAVNVDSIPSITNVISPVAGDPPSPAIGDIWYNSVAKKLRYEGEDPFGAWASGPALNTARHQASDFGASSSSMALAGGFEPSRGTATEEYNGTSFSTSGALPTVVGGAGGSGTVTAGTSFGGSNSSPGSTGFTNRTNEYDGSTWTTVNNMNTGTPFRPGTGTQTDTIAAGSAINFPPTSGTVSEAYDGTTWTSTPSLSTARYAKDIGSGASALAIAGQNSPSTTTNAVEEWNDSSWTAVSSTNTNKGGHGAAGTTTSALAYGGATSDPLADPSNIQYVSEAYDGSTWTTLPSASNVSQYRTFPANAGTRSSAMSAGGNSLSGVVTSTEIFTQGPETKNFAND